MFGMKQKDDEIRSFAIMMIVLDVGAKKRKVMRVAGDAELD